MDSNNKCCYFNTLGDHLASGSSVAYQNDWFINDDPLQGLASL